MRFALNDQHVDVPLSAPDRTLLELLRLDLGHCGTKEGCASGDCGACTVLVSEPDAAGSDSGRYRSVNACIAPAAAFAGCHVITVEGLARDGVLHPAQRAMVEQHGSQCGFCTPGFVMSLAALHDEHRDRHPADIGIDRATVLEAISGNLCRCTGYRPIIAAAGHMAGLPGRGPLSAIRPAARVTSGDAAIEALPGYLRPSDEAGLRRALAEHADARLIAGGTDLMLEHTQQYRDLGALIDVRGVAELNVVESTATHWRLGAAVPLTDLLALFRAELPELAELLERFGSPQIRNRGSLGGNLGTGSPIGDLSPVLQALGAELLLGHVDGGNRTIAVDAFHLDYRRTALARGEYIALARIPKPEAADLVSIRKYSKRHEDDISSVLGAACVRRSATGIDVRLAFGGVAATPLRVASIETLLQAYAADDRDADPDPELLRPAVHAALAAAITPLSDVRASAGYRLAMAEAFVLDVARALGAAEPDRAGDPQ